MSATKRQSPDEQAQAAVIFFAVLIAVMTASRAVTEEPARPARSAAVAPPRAAVGSGLREERRTATESIITSKSDLPLLLTVPEAAHLLRIGRDLAYSLAAQQKIPTVRLGRRVLVPRDALLRWLSAAEVPNPSDESVF